MKQLVALFLAAAFLTSCGSESSQEKTSEKLEQNEKTITYIGTVIDFGQTHDSGLFLADLTPINFPEAAAFDEVILLTDDVSLVDQSTGEAIALSELVKGDSVQVTLIEHAPTTMSIPPQIAGNGIIKIEKTTEE